jgi:hypothetical protein
MKVGFEPILGVRGLRMLFIFGIGFVVGLVLGLRRLIPQIVKQQKGEDKG